VCYTASFHTKGRIELLKIAKESARVSLCSFTVFHCDAVEFPWDLWFKWACPLGTGHKQQNNTIPNKVEFLLLFVFGTQSKEEVFK